MSPRHRRTLFREVNESIRGVSAAFSVAPTTLELLCECEQEECVERIPVPPAAYAAARASGRYVIAPGHEVPHDRLVGGSEAYSIVSANVLARPQLRVA